MQRHQQDSSIQHKTQRRPNHNTKEMDELPQPAPEQQITDAAARMHTHSKTENTQAMHDRRAVDRKRQEMRQSLQQANRIWETPDERIERLAED